MAGLQQILCAVDFSDCSLRALEYAAVVARQHHAHLTVLHVYSSMPAFDTPIADPDPDAIGSMVRVFMASVAADADTSPTVIHAEDVRNAIVAEADRLGADILVIGSHGRSGLDRLLLGSTTEKVVRKAQCPVLVVPHRAEPAVAPVFQRIVCGIDFSAASIDAFRYAVRLGTPSCDIRLIHAIEVPPEVREMRIAAAFDVEAVRAATEAACLQRLEAIRPGDIGPGCRISAQVAEGRAHRHLVRVAQEQHADLIVVGTQGRSALDRWFFGSTTHAILRDAPCPVLTVRP